MERILIVAPAWIGDAILSEPLVALVRDPFESPIVDVLAPAWCAAVYACIGRIIDDAAHGRFNWRERRTLAKELSANGYTRAIVLPNSWKSALVRGSPPHRTGYVGEARWPHQRHPTAQHRALPARRSVALAVRPGELVPMPPRPVLVPDLANRAAAVRALRLRIDRKTAILCPGAEYGPAKRWPPTHFAELASRFLADGMQVWLVGSPNDKLAAESVMQAAGETSRHIRDLTGRTDLGTAIDLLSLASIVVSNDSGLMHAAAAVGRPMVALFGSSSPVYTPPLSTVAQVARISIACSPCFSANARLGFWRM
jgi:heptosyltransferase-2